MITNAILISFIIGVIGMAYFFVHKSYENIDIINEDEIYRNYVIEDIRKFGMIKE